MNTQVQTRFVTAPARIVARGPRCKALRCAVAKRDVKVSSPLKESKQKLEAAAVDSFPSDCYFDHDAAHEFNSCFLHFDELDETQAERCLGVARDVADSVGSEDTTEICDEEVCTKPEHVNWFVDFVSSTFGLE